jgi:formylglycine-generating enzyme required for sulfatase activity
MESLGNAVPLEMVAIPGGSFTMGALENEYKSKPDERPLHRVTIKPFYMSKYAITQSQYLSLMGNNPSDFPGRNRPVENVSWYDAQQFCINLSQRTGKTYRLPSEAEWEFACRAGTTTPFYCGETITTDLANYIGIYVYRNETPGKNREITTEVGSFPPNPFGLYDMHGNVWEWCEDVYHDSYNGLPTDGTAWIEPQEQNRPRSIRGGSLNTQAWHCRSASRFQFDPYGIADGIGFRVVCDASESI